MARREVSIGVCGAIVGVLIGVGSMVYGQNMTGSVITGDQLVSYRDFILQNASRRRQVQEEDRRTRPFAVVEEHASSSSRAMNEMSDMMTEEELQMCAHKVEIAEELRSLIIPLVPGRSIDQLVRTSMQEVFDAYVADCLQAMGEQAATTTDGSVEVMGHSSAFEYCDRYSGAKRIDCIVEQRRAARQ